LWKSADKAAEAAETLGITATRLKALGLVDKVVNEPLGGAHRDHDAMMQLMKKALTDTWRQLREKSIDEVLKTRFEKLVNYGKFKEVEAK
jgi:acetyl-CoA carboxylase carboxyl transferase subunit alpha